MMAYKIVIFFSAQNVVRLTRSSGVSFLNESLKDKSMTNYYRQPLDVIPKLMNEAF